MSTTELERRLAEVLTRHAEDAMDNTNTEERLGALLEKTRRHDTRRRRWWASGLLAAAAAGVIAVSFLDRGAEQADLDPVGQTEPARVASEYVQAVAVYDLPRAETYLSSDELEGWGGSLDAWRRSFGWFQAAGFTMDVHSCHRQGTTATATLVTCDYDFQSLGSDELGLGPFSGSTYLVKVQNGAVVLATNTVEFETNDFGRLVWGPFGAWVRKNHPAAYELMYSDQGDQLTTDESLALWRKLRLAYVAAETGGS